MDHAAQYAERLKTPDQASALIVSGAKVAMGLGVSQPPALLKALAERAERGEVEDVNLYYLLSTAIAGETVLRYELMDRIRPWSLFHSAIERRLEQRAHKEGRPNPVQFIPTGFQQSPRLLCDEVGVDTLVCTVSPMDEDGLFSFGTNTDYSKPVSQTAKTVIVEVNPHMPRVFGDCTVHVSKVAGIVEHSAPLLVVPRAEPQPADLIIGRIIADLVEDGATLQMGIGALPNAVCDALKDHRDLGVHTEMLTPGLVELMQAGVANHARKTLHPGVGVFAFSMGDLNTYEFLDGNRGMEAHPVSYVNDPAVIARNARMISVNATLQIDLTGACCSEFLNGRQFTAAGGQLDFVRGAYGSQGGKSIMALYSTVKEDSLSSIVPVLSPGAAVTLSRNDVDYVVTEYGIASLRGTNLTERVKRLSAVAHPKFRDMLLEEAKKMQLC